MEIWRKDLDPANFAPMYNGPHGKHYYINEVVRMKNGEYVIPIRWLKWHGIEHADAY
jgi:hypothetical protein